MDSELPQMTFSVSDGIGLESDSEVELGLFILRSGPWAKSYHLIPTTSLLNRNPFPLFLENKTKAWEGEVTCLKVACHVSGRDGIQTQG